MRNEDVVRLFCEAWSRMDIDELLSFFTDDAVYHNIPMKPAKGKVAIRRVIGGFLKMARSFEFKIIHSAANDNIVFNERIDSIQLNAKRIELPVAGIFEFEGGKICAWRDYFDLGTWERQIS